MGINWGLEVINRYESNVCNTGLRVSPSIAHHATLLLPCVGHTPTCYRKHKNRKGQKDRCYSDPMVDLSFPRAIFGIKQFCSQESQQSTHLAKHCMQANCPVPCATSRIFLFASYSTDLFNQLVGNIQHTARWDTYCNAHADKVCDIYNPL